MAKKENNMYKKIDGIIVSEYPFEESSKIINILTKDGEYNIIAKGAKKIKSPFFAVTNKFTLGIFNIQYKEKGLSKLIDADIINNYSTIKKDINIYGAAGRNIKLPNASAFANIDKITMIPTGEGFNVYDKTNNRSLGSVSPQTAVDLRDTYYQWNDIYNL